MAIGKVLVLGDGTADLEQLLDQRRQVESAERNLLRQWHIAEETYHWREAHELLEAIERLHSGKVQRDVPAPVE